MRFPLTEGTIGYTLAVSGVSLGYIADCVMQENIIWREKELKLDDLWLAGTHPDWDKIIVEECHRSAKELRGFINSNSQATKLFPDFTFCDVPILVKFEEGKYKVLDGMKRVLAAIKGGKETIGAFVAETMQIPGRAVTFPGHKCEARVIYNLLNAYQLKINMDRNGLIMALRFLRNSYGNVGYLLKHRFSNSWFQGEEMQNIISESLKD